MMQEKEIPLKEAILIWRDNKLLDTIAICNKILNKRRLSKRNEWKEAYEMFSQFKGPYTIEIDPKFQIESNSIERWKDSGYPI